MTLDEAFQEIGIDPGSSLDEIRRAYLRKTRTWKPAADPDGLRRLHEAFGILQAEISTWTPPADAEPPAAPAQPVAGSLYDPSAPQERRAPRIVIQPVEKPLIFRWFTLVAGGLFLAVALWFWFSGHPGEISTAPPPSATDAVNKMCTPWPKEDLGMKWICRESKLLLDQVAKGECADARRSLSGLEEHWARRQTTMRDVAVQSLLEKEVARCLNLWDPNH